MAKVAIHTALQQTTLRPHFLYDGGENELTRWLRAREIPIISLRTSLYDNVAELRCYEDETNNRNIQLALRGIFLRAELPRLSEQLQMDDRVLYTDCDVFFRSEVADDFAGINCRYFAVAGEFDRENYYEMNTGVMWMNLPGLRESDAEFRNYIRQNLASLQTVAWDQGAYRDFFATSDTSFLWDKLRPELNWKPYWGDYAQAKIVHFHGPKPYQQSHIDSHFPELKHLTGGAYNELCAQWRDLLAEAG